MVNIKTLKYFENLLKVSSEIKQYVKNTISLMTLSMLSQWELQHNNKN